MMNDSKSIFVFDGISGWVALVSLMAMMIQSTAQGADVYAQLPSGIVTDPFYISATGSNYEAVADLRIGLWGAAASGNGPGAGFANSGLTQLTLTNTASTPLYLPFGAINARVLGSYSFGTIPGSLQQGADSGANFQMRTTSHPIPSVAAFGHTAYRSVLPDGTFNQGESITMITQTEGAVATPLFVTIEFLQFDLTMPPTVLAPGESMILDFQLTTSAVSPPPGSAVADFGQAVELTIDVPPGYDPTDLVHDAAVPIDFVRVPEPRLPFALTVGAAAVVAAGARRRRREAAVPA